MIKYYCDICEKELKTIEEIIEPRDLISFESTVAHDGGIKFGFKENHQGLYMEEELKCPKQ